MPIGSDSFTTTCHWGERSRWGPDHPAAINAEHLRAGSGEARVRLLVATDDSTHAHRALTLAARLAGELRAVEVTLINVGQIPPAALISPSIVGHVSFASLEQALERDSRRILHHGAEAFAGTDLRV